MYKYLSLFVSFCILTFTQVPLFKEDVTIKANGQPIKAELGCASPQVTDWNDDGKKDLLVGQFTGGKKIAFMQQAYNFYDIVNLLLVY